MPISFTREVADVPTRVDDFLAQRVERNVLASLLAHARAGRVTGSGALFAWGTGEDGEVRFYASRTPDWPLLVSELDERDADPLVERWLTHDRGVPGVTGVPASARAVADAWARRTRGRWGVRHREALHLLSEVVESRRPPGSLRRVREQDRELLIAWERAFVADAGIIPSAAAEAERTVERRIESGGAYVWHDGEPVSMLGLSPQIAGTVRIGPVYTPPERRRRGYASAAVAAVCADALARGACQCMLFTDLANPTSNKIYAAIGFRRVADWEELEFNP